MASWTRGIFRELADTRADLGAKEVKANQSIVAFDNIGGIQYTLQYFIDAHHLPITIRPYPGAFTWNEYVKLPTKGAYFAQAVSVSALTKGGILNPGHQVWFAFADGPASQVEPLLIWLSRHAVLKKKLFAKGWPVGFQLYQIIRR